MMNSSIFRCDCRRSKSTCCRKFSRSFRKERLRSSRWSAERHFTKKCLPRSNGRFPSFWPKECLGEDRRRAPEESQAVSARMKIPLLDLSLQNRALEPELKAAFERVLHSGQFIMGAEVESLETKIAQMIEVRHAVGVSSGTDAILLALMTLG